MGVSSLDNPVFVLTAARCGSTLMRRLLDAHPKVTCPPELNTAAIARTTFTTWMTTEDQATAAERERAAIDQSRRSLEAVMDWHRRAAAKPVYCEKSLINAEHADLLVRLFPDARFICLYRHAMDVVASIVESSPWGFRYYGVSPYIPPDNFVYGLTQYWIDRTARILAFEESHPDQCARVRYEDLVRSPESVLRRCTDLIGLAWDPAVLSSAWTQGLVAGPGDGNQAYTDGLHSRSIGTGAAVDVELIPEITLGVVNDLLARLQYPTVGPTWGMEASPLRGGILDPSRDAAVAAMMTGRVQQRLLGDRSAAERQLETRAPEVFRLLVSDCGEGSSWSVDLASGTVRRGGGGELPTILVDFATLVGLANSTLNPEMAMRKGGLRFNSSMEPGSWPESVLRAFLALIS